MSEGIAFLGQKLVGSWTTEATHPSIPGTVVPGTADIEWVEGQKFLLLRSHSEHPDFPDSVSVLGDTDGMHMHYFDSRGVHRVYDLKVTPEAWQISGVFPEFSQVITFAFTDPDTTTGTSKLAEDNVTWTDDMGITYHRAD